jgi:ABC-2 type transport system permease protein
MNGLSSSLWAEALKVRRSKMFLITVIFFAFIACMMGLMMVLVHHPELAGRSAAMSAKAPILGNGDWPSYLPLLVQVILSLGPIGFGMVTSWVFGREYADRTAKDLLALPVRRVTIVTAKFAVVMAWCLVLTLAFSLTALLVALGLGLPGWSAAMVRHTGAVLLGSSLLTMLLCTPVAFLACLSRGYLLPVGFAIFTLILANFVAIGLPGMLPWFPWAVPALYTGMAGADLPPAGASSYFILALTFISGFIATAAWWHRADQT